MSELNPCARLSCSKKVRQLKYLVDVHKKTCTAFDANMTQAELVKAVLGCEVDTNTKVRGFDTYYVPQAIREEFYRRHKKYEKHLQYVVSLASVFAHVRLIRSILRPLGPKKPSGKPAQPNSGTTAGSSAQPGTSRSGSASSLTRNLPLIRDEAALSSSRYYTAKDLYTIKVLCPGGW